MGMIINDWYIDNIKNGRLVCEENCWSNGKVGVFKDFDNNYQLRFIEAQGKYSIGHACTEADRFLPVSAQGFVAWLIKSWGIETQKLYSGYLQNQLNQYKTDHRKDPDVFKRDLDREFYNQYKTQEKLWVQQSEAIFDFISEVEVNKIKEYVKYYFEYLEIFQKQLKAEKNTKRNEIHNSKTENNKAFNNQSINKEVTTNIIVDKEMNYSKLLENYNFWNDIDDTISGRKNIFKDVSEQDFITMIRTANFTSICNRGISQRVKFNIYILSRLLGKNWGEKAAKNLKTTLEECSKRSEFYKSDSLKSMYLQ